ncbi:uncharacterized protein [Musca autumnalis]|uniref:uncharacterized protein n=1 Tax=Musca autumnalis TaxID=221902 RepID=UPI003CF68E62
MESKNLNKKPTKTNPIDDNNAMPKDNSSKSITKSGATQSTVDGTVVSGGDGPKVPTLGAVTDSLAEQSRKLLEILEQTLALRLSQGGYSTGAEDGSSDDEMNTTVIPATVVNDESASTSVEAATCMNSGPTDAPATQPSAAADVAGSKGLAAVEEGAPTKIPAGKAPTTSDSSASKWAKKRKAYHRAMHFLRKFIDREPSSITLRECKLIRINLKVVKKIERSHPHLPKGKPDISKLSLITANEEVRSMPTSTPTAPKGQTGSDVDMIRKPPNDSPPSTSKLSSKGCPVTQTGQTSKKKAAKPKGTHHKSSKSGKSDRTPVSAPGGAPTKPNPSPPKIAVKRDRSMEEPLPSAKRPTSGQQPIIHTSPAGCPKTGSRKDAAASSASQANLGHKESSSSHLKTNSRGKRTSRPMVPDELRAAVIDKSDPDWVIREDRWLLIETRLRDIVFAGEGEPPKHTQFGSAAPYRGVRVICCENRESLDFLTSTIEGLGELWEGCQLAVVGVNEVPFRRVLSAWVPPPPVDPARILTILGRQNPNLRTSTWNLVSHNPENGGVAIRVSIDTQGQEYLRTREGKLHFGLGWIRFRLGRK